MQIQYLEIVSEDVESTVATYSTIYNLTFGEPVAVLGNARTAKLSNGGKIGVRAAMSASEVPVVRPYMLVQDVASAVAAAEAAGAKIAHPPLELPGEGIFAIYNQNGIEHGLWQLTP